MSFKRFFQLFIIYLVAILICEGVSNALHLDTGGRIAVFAILGYMILTIPLTILTILKNKKS